MNNTITQYGYRRASIGSKNHVQKSVTDMHVKQFWPSIGACLPGDACTRIGKIHPIIAMQLHSKDKPPSKIKGAPISIANISNTFNIISLEASPICLHFLIIIIILIPLFLYQTKLIFWTQWKVAQQALNSLLALGFTQRTRNWLCITFVTKPPQSHALHLSSQKWISISLIHGNCQVY